ncbi:MAG: hypothetical protein ACI9BW_002761 [Gammaproteobacteria bacterium]|jgi:hypothetical protein
MVLEVLIAWHSIDAEQISSLGLANYVLNEAKILTTTKADCGITSVIDVNVQTDCSLKLDIVKLLRMVGLLITLT